MNLGPTFHKARISQEADILRFVVKLFFMLLFLWFLRTEEVADWGCIT